MTAKADLHNGPSEGSGGRGVISKSGKGPTVTLHMTGRGCRVCRKKTGLVKPPTKA